MKLRIIYTHTKGACTYIYFYASLVESINKYQKASVFSSFWILNLGFPGNSNNRKKKVEILLSIPSRNLWASLFNLAFAWSKLQWHFLVSFQRLCNILIHQKYGGLFAQKFIFPILLRVGQLATHFLG